MKCDLFDLIQSLSKNEKRYFKLETTKQKSKSNHYLTLYTILEKQQSYNEALLIEELQKRAPQTIKRLSANKNYLYQFILKSLCRYYESKSSAMEFSNLMQRVEIVYTKGLYKQALKILNQAKKIAEINQMHTFLLQVYQWEYKLVFLEEKYYKSLRKTAQIQQQQSDSVQHLNMRFEYDQKYTETYGYIYQNGPPNSLEEKEKFRNITSFDSVSKGLETRYTDDIYHFVKSTYHYFLGNLEEALLHAKSRVAIFENHQQLIVDDTHQYLKVVYNYIQTLLAFERPNFEEILRYINKAEQIVHQPKIILDGRTEKIRYFLIYSHSTRVYMEQGLFEKANDIGRQLKKRPNIYAQLDKNENEFFIYLNLAFCNFVCMDLDEAIYWIQKVLNDTSITVRFDLLAYARILNLMIHYELKNFNVLPFLIDSTQRFMKEHKQLKTPEKLLLSMFRKINNSLINDKIVQKTLRKTTDAFYQYKIKEPHAHEHLNQYRVLEWIESKLKNQTYIDLILQNIYREKG